MVRRLRAGNRLVFNVPLPYDSAERVPDRDLAAIEGSRPHAGADPWKRKAGWKRVALRYGLPGMIIARRNLDVAALG